MKDTSRPAYQVREPDCHITEFGHYNDHPLQRTRSYIIYEPMTRARQTVILRRL